MTLRSGSGKSARQFQFRPAWVFVAQRLNFFIDTAAEIAGGLLVLDIWPGLWRPGEPL